jgi:hypothetical protein
MADRSSAARKAAQTRKRKAAGNKAARTRKLRGQVRKQHLPKDGERLGRRQQLLGSGKENGVCLRHQVLKCNSRDRVTCSNDPQGIVRAQGRLGRGERHHLPRLRGGVWVRAE